MIAMNASWLRTVALLAETKVNRREERKRCCMRFQELRNFITLVFR